MAQDDIAIPPFETNDLRVNLANFLNTDFLGKPVGNYQCGVYAFYDYDGEPIYVGQTSERLGTRIRRHLTNQRTDAVAMSVLDPYEVFEIEVFPLLDFEGVSKKSPLFNEVKEKLDALEYAVFTKAISDSHFKAILNEKDPPKSSKAVIPESVRRRVVSDKVFEIRSHPDSRIARRALILSKLAQVISERKVSKGLRRTLLTQSKRLQWLAERRHNAASNDEGGDED